MSAVVSVCREIKILLGFEMNWPIRVGLYEHRNDTFVLSQGAELLGATDVREEGTSRKKRQHHVAAIERQLNLGSPTSSRV